MAEEMREYKDRLFCFIFGSEEHKEWTLSLYNAVNGTHYTDPSLITIATLTQVLYMGMQDDVAVMVQEMDMLDLYEHQASYNPNMPLRLMQYAGNIYEALITLWDKNKFSSKLIKLPVPKLVVFYNGTAEQPDEKILNLSDAFPEDKRDQSDIQVRVRMININKGHNPKLTEGCKPLSEYVWMIDKVRTYEKTDGLEPAIDRALREMPEDFEIKRYLEANREGVKKMLLTEYDEVKTMRQFKEEGREEGIEQGIEQGIEREKVTGIKRAINKLHMTLDAAMDYMDIAAVDQPRYANLLKEEGIEYKAE